MAKQEEKQAILEKTDGKCAYCGCDLNLKSMTIDHVDPIVRPLELRNHQIVTKNVKGTPDQEHIDNKLPACRSCNSYKSSSSIESFRQRIAHWPDVFIGNNPCFRAMLRFGIIEIIKKPVVFEFEHQENQSDNETVYSHRVHISHNVAPYCPVCRGGEYLHNEDGNRNNYCGSCGIRLDWDLLDEDKEG